MIFKLVLSLQAKKEVRRFSLVTQRCKKEKKYDNSLKVTARDRFFNDMFSIGRNGKIDVNNSDCSRLSASFFENEKKKKRKKIQRN